MKTHYYFIVFVTLGAFLCAGEDPTTNVWGPVTNNIRMSIMIKAPEAFSRDDLNVQLLMERFRRRSDPLTIFLWGKLSNEAQSLLTNYQDSTASSNRVAVLMVQILNRIIAGENIYDNERYRGIVVRGEAKGIMQQNPHGSMLAHLNRLLLEDAFPVELSRSLRGGDTKMQLGDPIVLTIAITNLSTNETFYVPTAHGIYNDNRYSWFVVTPSGKGISPHGDLSRVRAQSNYTLDPTNITQLIFTFPLSEICAFDEIGDYIITAHRVVDWPGGKKGYVTFVDDDGTRKRIAVEPQFTVVSNPLTIKILQRSN